jgi:hypothetical protein
VVLSLPRFARCPAAVGLGLLIATEPVHAGEAGILGDVTYTGFQ